MVEQEVEQKRTEMWVIPGKAGVVGEESRRHWTLLNMERRRKLTTPVKMPSVD